MTPEELLAHLGIPANAEVLDRLGSAPFTEEEERRHLLIDVRTWNGPPTTYLLYVPESEPQDAGYTA